MPTIRFVSNSWLTFNQSTFTRIMDDTQIKINSLIKYWRNSLADSDWISRTHNETHNYEPYLCDTGLLSNGILDDKLTSKLISQSNRSKSKKDEYAELIIAPIVFRLKSDRLSKDILKTQWVTPLWIRAILFSDGKLKVPDKSDIIHNIWIRREYLTPSPSQITLGSISEQDKLLANHELNSGIEWSEYMDIARELITSFSDWKKNITRHNFELSEKENIQQSIIMPKGKLSSDSRIIRQLMYVYNDLLTSNKPKILSSYCQANSNETKNILPKEKFFLETKEHLGHYKKYNIAPTQRIALAHILQTKKDDIFAVNGPPGTGKTILIGDVVASLYVKHAIAGKKPPIIVVSSTNNQAIFNALEDLQNFHEIERWLPEPIVGIGLCLISDSNKENDLDKLNLPWSLAGKGTFSGFSEAIEDENFIEAAEEFYINKSNEYLNTKYNSINDIKKDIYLELVHLHTDFVKGVELAEEYFLLNEKYGDLKTVEQELNRLFEDCTKASEYNDYVIQADTTWKEYIANESLWIVLLSFIPAIKRKQIAKDAVLLKSHFSKIKTKFDKGRKNIDELIVNELISSEKIKNEVKNDFDKYEIIANNYNDIYLLFKNWCSKYKIHNTDIRKIHLWEESNSFINELDLKFRNNLFMLSLHYWESRWLITVKKFIKECPDRKERQYKEKRLQTWHRYAMLTPCFVTTLHSGPRFFDYWDKKRIPHYNLIDYLLIDEAGQVAPEIALPMVSLSKRTIMIGDTEQLKPINNLTDGLDKVNYESVINKNEFPYEAALDDGLCSKSGTAMHIGKKTCGFRTKLENCDEHVNGAFLLEHRRCVPEIIAYSNELSYKNQIIPKRQSLEYHPWPHIGYSHIKGVSEADSFQSRINDTESTTLVNWLFENMSNIINHYNSINNRDDLELKDLVGIITPFSSQAFKIVKQLNKKNIDLDKIGTVYSLQGAAKPIILFSSVYTSLDSNNNRYFMLDNENTLLNVAVSRAKDSFIVFGDMDIFDPKVFSPSGILGKYLFEYESNEILTKIIREDSFRYSEHCDDIACHRAWLNNSFKSATTELIIISPFIALRAIQADNIPSLISDAIKKNIVVKIYIDEGFKQSNESTELAIKLLNDAGAIVTLVRNVHSKLLIVDEHEVIEGSFNWLSAERTNKDNMRYETSSKHTGKEAKMLIKKFIKEIESRIIQIF